MALRSVRPIRIEGNVAFIPLTKGFETVIDAEDAPLFEGYNWCVQVTPHTVYALRRSKQNGISSTVYVHRIVLRAQPGEKVDHRSGDGLDNRKSNLRLATAAENMHNQRLSAANSSGFKGVSWHKRSGKWRAHITISGMQKHLGLFDAPEAAHSVYAAEAERLFGEFARTA